MDELSERIRERAYRIWLDEGQPEGREDAHWEQARREVQDASENPPGDDGGKERRLDAGLDETFPSSDPASESQPGGGITGPSDDH